MNEDLISDPCLRLFLSVDIVGSTKLKDEINHAKLLSNYEDRLKGIKSYNSVFKKPMDSFPIDFDRELITSILSDKSQENSDWATILEQQFSDFHSDFLNNYSKLKDSSEANLFEGPIWKCLGDELIYQFPIKEIQQLHFLTLSFLTTLRKFDKAAREKQVSQSGGRVMRMKGVGWVAGFPIRNREVSFPGKKDPDFLGPDVDIGFRLGKHSYPGFMCVSMDLAYLLGKHQSTEQLLGNIVGWSRLKGVWDDNPYPIIWIATPDYNTSPNYQDLKPWAAYENEYAANWEKQERFEELKALKEKINEIREDLPASLYIVKPYIHLNDNSDPMPERHLRIHAILKALSPGAAGKQEDDEEVPSKPDELEKQNEAIRKKIETLETKK